MSKMALGVLHFSVSLMSKDSSFGQWMYLPPSANIPLPITAVVKCLCGAKKLCPKLQYKDLRITFASISRLLSLYIYINVKNHRSSFFTIFKGDRNRYSIS